MKLFSVAAVACLLAGCESVPAWNPQHVREVRFVSQAPGSSAPRSVTDPASIETVLRCLRSAEKIEANRADLSWPCVIDIVGDRPERGRWLYNPASGLFTRLDHRQHTLCRLTESDRALLNRLLAGPNR